MTDASSEAVTNLPPGIRPGSVVAGYRLDEQIGQGGMAVVFRARHERLGRYVALKVLHPAYARDAAFRERFVHESRVAAKLDHPHIIPLHEADEADGILYIAMRFVLTGDLGSLVERAGPLPAARACAIIADVASALDAAHAAGLVHRDVKPANMLLDYGPDRPDHVYLSDFGLVKDVAIPGLTLPNQMLGTPEYMAPEQQFMADHIDGRTDQYALACAVFTLLTGKPPFLGDQVHALMYAHATGEPPRLSERVGGVPAAADAVVRRALAKDPADRYASCRAFAGDLLATLAGNGAAPAGAAAAGSGGAGEPATVARPARSQPAPAGRVPVNEAETVTRRSDRDRRRPRRKVVIGAFAAVLLALAAGAGIIASALHSPAAPAATCATQLKPWIHRVQVDASAGSLRICPVDVNDGRPLGRRLSLSGRVIGTLPAHQLLIVAVYPDPTTCDNRGNPGTGTYFEIGRINPAANRGIWQITSGGEYQGSQTIRRYIYFLAGTKKDLQSFAASRQRYKTVHHQMAGYPGKPNIHGFTKLGFFSVRKKPPASLKCAS